MEKTEEKVAVGVPVQLYYGGENEYQRGMIPPNTVFGDPKGIPIQQTIYRDTPAPFNCPYCAHTALTTVRLCLFSLISIQTILSHNNLPDSISSQNRSSSSYYY